MATDTTFFLADGREVKTIKELLDVLRSLDPNTFYHHVTTSRNDFASWVRHSHKYGKLADLLDRVKSREVMVHVLQIFVTEQERLSAPRPATPPPMPQAPPPRAAAPVAQSPPEASPPAVPPSLAADPPVQTKPADAAVDDFFKAPAEVPETPVPVPQRQTASVFPTKEERKAEARAGGKPDVKAETVVDIEKFSPKPADKKEAITEEEARRYSKLLEEMQHEINKVFIGQEDIVNKVLLCLVCEAHTLLEGVPGLAKSLLVEVLSHVIEGTSFHRIQFLPDMLPADIIGGQIYNPNTGDFSTVKGPVFANFILADEINRAPPKTHAALMEVMQEKKVNIDKIEYPLDRPFLVLATQNPLENKGTYALPEAVLDRFMFKLDLDYPTRAHEKLILTENATTKAELSQQLRSLVNKQELLGIQKRIKTVFISNKIRDYILDILEATRGKNKAIEGYKFVKYGCGPRAGIYLTIGAKARAMQCGRVYVLPEDVNYVAPDIMRHRLALNFTGKAHGVSSDKIVQEILSKVTAI